MKEKIEELYNYYLEKKLDLIFDSENNNSVTSYIVENQLNSGTCHNGYVRIKNSMGCYNYHDFYGHLLLDEWYDEAEEFHDGYATVKKYFQEYGCVKENVIDTTGKLLSDEWYDEIKYEDNTIYGINHQNDNNIDSTIIKQNYAPIRRPNYKKVINDNMKLNYKRTDGTFVLSEWVDYLEDYSDGYALVRNNGKYNLVDVNGNYLYKGEWFDYIYNYYHLYGIHPITDGYVIVYRNGKFNVLDLNGNELIDWTNTSKIITLHNNFSRYDIISFIDLKGYEVTKTTKLYNEISNGKETYRIKGFPIRVYDDYILCARYLTSIDKEYPKFAYYLFNKKTNQYEPLGRNYIATGFTVITGTADYEHCYTFDDNFIHDHYNKKVYFIYGNQKIDITDYYNRKISGKKSISVDKKLSKILSIDEFHYENIEAINQILREEKEREIKEQERLKDQALLERVKTKIDEIEEEEKLRRKTVDELKAEIEQRFKILEQLEYNVGLPRIKYNKLFKRVADSEGFHYEFNDLVIKNNRLHMFDLSQETFTNVKMNGIDFRKCNLDNLRPREVYKKNLSGCNFEGVHFGPFTSFSGVDIRGSKFSYDKNNKTMDVMPYFNEAIFDETTTFNGIPLTNLIKRKDETESLFVEDSQARKISV